MRKPLLFAVLGAFSVGLVLWATSSHKPSEVTASVDLLMPFMGDLEGYARAIEPYTWEFPADHGAHPAFQTEWWYYTGNLADETGRRFGYQFTVFRRATSPKQLDTTSEWRSNQLYMAHFTVSDITANRFHQFQRFSRGAAGLAGAVTAPRYQVWLDDWSVTALNDEATLVQLKASEGIVTVDVRLEQHKPPALQGDNGLSAKSSEPGNASYYYSLSRLLTSGTLTIQGETFAVTGTTWMDHEFSTSALGTDAQGWDWFGLHLDDGRDLMIGQIRLTNGEREPAFGGLLIAADGTTRYLPSDSFEIAPTGTWTSKKTGTTYPAGWIITIRLEPPHESDSMELAITPLMADQELVEGAIIYWEGAVQVEGDATGYGYAELTGYHSAMQGRF